MGGCFTVKEKYYAQEISQIEKELNTSLDNGLSDNEAKKRLASDGPNSLASKKKRSMFMRFIDQFKDFMIIVLIVAAILSGVVANEWTDAAIIMIVIKRPTPIIIAFCALSIIFSSF